MAEAPSTRFRVTGMDCGACAAKIDAAVRRMPGIEEVSVSATTGGMTVRHRPDPGLFARIEAQLDRLGYGLSPADRGAVATGLACGEHRDDQDHDAQAVGLQGPRHVHDSLDAPWWRGRKAGLTIVCGVALAAAYGLGWIVPEVGTWAFLAAMLAGLLPIAQRAWSAARLGQPFTIETLMTIAAVGAVVIGATEEAAAVVLLFLIGELLEGVAAGRARASIQGLAALVPKTALLERAGRPETVPAETLGVGDRILVRPGDRIPADGEILEGESLVDEAPVTGESTPKRKVPGDRVFAGTIASDGLLRIGVTAGAADNTIARVVRLVEEAQESKAPTERFIDRFSRWYTPGVIALGALVALLPPLLGGADWSEWLYKGLAILLIGCPCALVISTPAAIAAALSAGARRGLLMKGGAVLETMGRVTAVAFDKTGTLTSGRPQVTDVIGFGRDERTILALAAALEQGSSHPLALALLKRAEAEGLAPPAAAGLRAVPGKGVAGEVAGERLFLGSSRAAADLATITEEQAACVAALQEDGKSVSLLLVEGAVAGLVALRDEPRDDAAAGIAALRAAGVAPVMLTGDNRRSAEAVARRLGIEAQADLLPEDKQRIVRELQRRGGLVAKVGDGINDAPALAAADVGIAMGGGTDVALETGDAAILHSRVLDVARMVRLARLTLRNIWQNIGLALGLKAVFLATTILGITGLWPAILADTGATVLVTLNALRLLRVRLP